METLRRRGRLALLALSGMFLSGCASFHQKGRLINLESGEEVLVQAAGSRDGALLLEGTLAGGRSVRGELWEVRAFEVSRDGGEALPYPPGDTVYYGTGFLRDGDWVLDFKYHRHQASWASVGTATDNRGGRYKVIFWTARKPRAAAVAKR